MNARPNAVLVTGATGFVGSHVCQHLLAAPERWQVHALARTDSAAAALRAALPGVHVRRG